MNQSTDSQPIPMIEEHEATGEVAEIFDEVKRQFQLPFVPNSAKTFAVSSNALHINWEMVKALYSHLTLPFSLVAMINYIVSEHHNCEYCSANNELLCRNLGIDEATLAQVAQDLGNVNPQRVRVIIEFAVKMSLDPIGISHEDYEKMWDMGVTDDEILEIVLVTANIVSAILIADTLKVPVESAVYAGLGR